MALLLVTPTILSLLLLGAHLMRAGFAVFVVPILVLLPLLFLTQRWVARTFQMLLVFAALEWLRTALFRCLERHDAGEPWLRMALILGACAGFTLFAALLFESETLKETYPPRSSW